MKKKSPFRKGADGVVAQRLYCGMRFETSRVSDHPEGVKQLTVARLKLPS